MESKLIRITSRYFCAGMVIEYNKVIKAAPILYKTFFGLTEEKCKEISKRNSWRWEEIRKEN